MYHIISSTMVWFSEMLIGDFSGLIISGSKNSENTQKKWDIGIHAFTRHFNDQELDVVEPFSPHCKVRWYEDIKEVIQEKKN